MDSWVHHHLHVSCLELTEAELDGEEDDLKKLGELQTFLELSKSIQYSQDVSLPFSRLGNGISCPQGPPLYLHHHNLRI